jgi:hypothetical protein
MELEGLGVILGGEL